MHGAAAEGPGREPREDLGHKRPKHNVALGPRPRFRPPMFHVKQGPSAVPKPCWNDVPAQSNHMPAFRKQIDNSLPNILRANSHGLWSGHPCCPSLSAQVLEELKGFTPLPNKQRCKAPGELCIVERRSSGSSSSGDNHGIAYPGAGLPIQGLACELAVSLIFNIGSLATMQTGRKGTSACTSVPDSSPGRLGDNSHNSNGMPSMGGW